MRHLLLVLPTLALFGCGASMPEPILVRPNDTSALAGVDLTKQPVVIEFQPGDVLPLALVVDGDLIGTPRDREPTPLTVKRHFFLRVSSSGLEVSLDNVHYGTKPVQPGRFSFGVGFDKTGTRATLAITTPQHAELHP